MMSSRRAWIAMSLAWLCASTWHSSSFAQSEEESEPIGGPEVLHIPQSQRLAEQGILRPVPIVADLPFELATRARRVLVHYRLWGDPYWTTLELRRNGARYEGAIPCLEISTVTGNLKYYIRVHDAEGRVIATGASRAVPYLVTIKHDEQLETPTTRAKCPDPGDCPAGLAGCPSEKVVEIACKVDSDCEDGATCSWRGFCEHSNRKKNWLSLGVSQEFGIVPATGACSIYQQENAGYACFRADGDQYIGNAVLTNEQPAIAQGTTRVVAGFDRLVHYGTTIGLRVGWTFWGEGPTPRQGTPFVPFTASARATHWFGEDPFARSGWRPFIFFGAGYAMVDLVTTTFVREDPHAPSYQGGNDLEQTVQLWKRAGDGFVGIGGGAMYAWAVDQGAFVELSAQAVFPFAAVVITPTAGVTFGF